jgi:hypothetical protein
MREGGQKPVFRARDALKSLWAVAVDVNNPAAIILRAMNARFKRIVRIVRADFHSQEGGFTGNTTSGRHLGIVGLRQAVGRSRQSALTL